MKVANNQALWHLVVVLLYSYNWVFYRLRRVYFSDRDESSPGMSLFLQEHLNVFRRSGCLISGRTLLGSPRKFKTHISVSYKEDELQYSPNNKEAKGKGGSNG
jgi:hypothetical protein